MSVRSAAAKRLQRTFTTTSRRDALQEIYDNASTARAIEAEFIADDLFAGWQPTPRSLARYGVNVSHQQLASTMLTLERTGRFPTWWPRPELNGSTSHVQAPLEKARGE